jgi:hypothetical protein
MLFAFMFAVIPPDTDVDVVVVSFTTIDPMNAELFIKDGLLEIPPELPPPIIFTFATQFVMFPVGIIPQEQEEFENCFKQYVVANFPEARFHFIGTYMAMSQTMKQGANIP